MESKVIKTEKRTKNGQDSRGKFVKGNKLGGRKPIPENVKEAFGELVPTALEKLKNILETSTDERVVLDAAKIIFDRNYGRPTQTKDISIIKEMPQIIISK